MKIALCASMAFAQEMIEIKNELKELGHEVIIQQDIESHAKGVIKEGEKWDKIIIDPFKTYFEEIRKCDAILVINKNKNGIVGYIGGNTLIEMAFAYILNKKIFLLNQIPEMHYRDEITYMKPIIVNANLSKLI